ncbi:MAG: DNA polymerase III subunit gamma/tau [Candidatus Marinimicrobia bacterium]|nr:DNA polymerase III subunit gamma/tau [Candidatus Neomarinimicrobiota bacterium]
MEYKVFSRKYRPQTFDEIVGQEHISKTLQNAIQSNRISHAYLFTGSRGIGKTTTARILAKTLNCSDPDGLNPCNECQNCREITNGRSVNVIEIDGASNRGIDEVRELRENVKYPPSEANYRVFIIDEVHMLTKPAFNALLKTLEEPPPHAIFIFATTEPVKVPETIISRCQRYDFHRIAVSTIVKQLQYIAEEEGVEIDDNILTLIAKKADGGMRDAESLLDQMVAFSDQKVDPERAKQILGLIDYRYYNDIGKMIRNQEQKDLIQASKDIFNKGVELGEFFTGLSEHFRNLLIANKTQSVDMLDLPGNVQDMYIKEAEHWNAGDLLRLVGIVNDAHTSLKSAINQRTHLEFTLLKMGNMDSTVSIQQLLDKLGDISSNQNVVTDKKTSWKSGKKSNSSTSKTKKNVKKDKNSKKVEQKQQKKENKLTLEDVQKSWPTIQKKVTKRKRSVGTFLDHGDIVNIRKNTIEINFHKNNKLAFTNIRKNSTMVEEIATKELGQRVKIKCNVTSDSKKDYSNTNELDEVVKKVSDDIDGEVII